MRKQIFVITLVTDVVTSVVITLHSLAKRCRFIISVLREQKY